MGLLCVCDYVTFEWTFVWSSSRSATGVLPAHCWRCVSRRRWCRHPSPPSASPRPCPCSEPSGSCNTTWVTGHSYCSIDLFHGFMKLLAVQLSWCVQNNRKRSIKSEALQWKQKTIRRSAIVGYSFSTVLHFSHPTQSPVTMCEVVKQQQAALSSVLSPQTATLITF